MKPSMYPLFAIAAAHRVPQGAARGALGQFSHLQQMQVAPQVGRMATPQRVRSCPEYPSHISRSDREAYEREYAEACYSQQAGPGPSTFEEMNNIADCAYMAVYAAYDPPFPIPPNWQSLPRCKKWVNAWLRIRQYVDTLALEGFGNADPPFPPVPGP